MKVIKVGNSIWFWCPGCKTNHRAILGKWVFNNDFDNPTIAPSIISNPNQDNFKCHLFIVNGKIKYLSDCDHDLKGQEIEMENIKE